MFGFVMCGYLYVWVFVLCGCVFCNEWLYVCLVLVMCGGVYVCVLKCAVVCICRFCNEWECVSVDFLMCCCMNV